MLYPHLLAALHRWDSSLLRSQVARARVVLHLALASCNQSGQNILVRVRMCVISLCRPLAAKVDFTQVSVGRRRVSFVLNLD